MPAPFMKFFTRSHSSSDSKETRSMQRFLERFHLQSLSSCVQQITHGIILPAIVPCSEPVPFPLLQHLKMRWCQWKIWKLLVIIKIENYLFVALPAEPIGFVLEGGRSNLMMKTNVIHDDEIKVMGADLITILPKFWVNVMVTVLIKFWSMSWLWSSSCLQKNCVRPSPFWWRTVPRLEDKPFPCKECWWMCAINWNMKIHTEQKH